MSNLEQKKISISPDSWNGHEREQILYCARHSTPLQRLRWLEEMLIALDRNKVLKENPSEKSGNA